MLSILAAQTVALPQTAPVTDIANTNVARILATIGGSLLSIVVLVSLISLILWIWALVDLVKRNFPHHGDKALWLAILIISFILGWGGLVALIYLVAGRHTSPTCPECEEKSRYYHENDKESLEERADRRYRRK